MTQAVPRPAADLPTPTLSSRLVSGLLDIKPLAHFAKKRARAMMVKRAEGIGIYWEQEVAALRSRGEPVEFSPQWEADRASLEDPSLSYPDYYLEPIHAYEEANLGWLPAMETEVAAKAVHARLWPEETAQGDIKLRTSYTDVLRSRLPEPPQAIVDLGCSVGMSTFSLQETFPAAQMTGVDLSPYFLAIAQYRDHQRSHDCAHDCAHHDSDDDSNVSSAPAIAWRHAAAESTGLPAQSADLVSFCLIFHELPRTAALQALAEAQRLLKPGGHLAMMDMNPHSEIYAKMPPYVLTLLKSTEPFLDDYFSFDLLGAIEAAGFEPPQVTCNTSRHRTILARRS